MELYPFQTEGARFLADRERAILGDEMGLGKTVQAIRAADLVGADRVTVVCPASVRPVWSQEMKAWSLLAPETQVYSYSELVSNSRSRSQALQHTRGGLLVLDECHYLKSPNAKRTRVCYEQLARHADRVWGLSGTLVPNNVTELWTHTKAMAGEELSYTEWAERYCYLAPSDYGPFRVLRPRRDMTPELRAKLSGWLLRRRTQDVALELPPMSWGTLPVEPERIQLPDEERELLRKLQAVLRAAQDDDDTAQEALRRAAPHLPTLRRLTGLVKAHAVARALKDEMAEGGLPAVVVFAYHREVLETLYEAFGGPRGAVMIHGSTPAAQREAAVTRFQSGSVPVFIGQITAAGTGLTLTRSNHLVFAEADWSPANMAQAAKRVHRIGQTLPTFIRVATLAGSLDEVINRVITRKARAITDLFRDGEAA